MTAEVLEARIADWRGYLAKSRTIDDADADELEGHLRDRIDELRAAGLDDDEAFLIAVKRLGSVDALSREYARSSSARLWKQLLPAAPVEGGRRELFELIGFAVGAAILIQLVRLASVAFFPSETGIEVGGTTIASEWFVRVAALTVLATLAAYLLRRRRASARRSIVVAVPFLAVALAMTLYPFPPGSSTMMLAALSLPVLLWLAVGLAYLGADWRSTEARMNFIRFVGEFFVYYVLIALGGFVLVALTVLILEPVVPGIETAVVTWVVPSGAAGAAIVAAWLVEAKQAVIENIAPVLGAVFTPLFALLVVVSLVSYLALGLGQEFDRDLLAVFNALLVVVLGLVLYSLSAREPRRPAGFADVLMLVTVIGALLLDLLTLWSILARIGELGTTPNRVAVLGLNLVLVVVLAGAAWLGARFVAGKAPLARLERWQTGYLPVYGAWAALVVFVLPLVFRFA